VKALVQRVTQASVTSEGVLVGEIGPGLCVLVGATHSDTPALADKLAERIFHLRIIDDDEGVMNLSVGQTGGAVLIVSQFTLYGDTNGGRRPSWIAAARPQQAEPLVERVVERLRQLGAEVETGRFRTDMQVSLVNDGPVTVMIEVP
jgi:D-aminoacyl-tRNA deacylase